MLGGISCHVYIQSNVSKCSNVDTHEEDVIRDDSRTVPSMNRSFTTFARSIHRSLQGYNIHATLCTLGHLHRMLTTLNVSPYSFGPVALMAMGSSQCPDSTWPMGIDAKPLVMVALGGLVCVEGMKAYMDENEAGEDRKHLVADIVVFCIQVGHGVIGGR